MLRSGRIVVRVFAVLGVMVVSATSSVGEQVSGRVLHFACAAAAGVDAARVSAICAEVLDLLKAQPDLQVVVSDGNAAETGAPGLELSVTRATDTQLELTPTWIDAAGQRKSLPSTGFVVMDTSMTAEMRRNLFQKILSSLPQ